MDFPIDEFFNDADLLDTATVGAVSISVHFFASREDLLEGNNRKIMVAAKTSDVASWTASTTPVIGGVTYYIKDIENDGSGITRITLSRTSLNPSN